MVRSRRLALTEAIFYYLWATEIFVLRAYSTTVAAAALGVTHRWLDAAVSTNLVPDVRPDRQGRSRAFSPHAIHVIAVAIQLIERLGTSLPQALRIGAELVERGSCEPGPELTLRVDIAAIERRIANRLADAVEATLPARRGRPPRRPTPRRPDAP